MPKVTCRFCGNDVILQGIGAICPHCGQLITAEQQQGNEVVDLLAPVELEDGPIPVKPIPVEPIPEPMPVEPVEAEPEPEWHEEEEGKSRTLLYSIIGVMSGLFIIALATVIILLTARSSPPPVVQAPVQITPQQPPPKQSPVQPVEPAPVRPQPSPTTATRPAPPPPPPLPPHGELAGIRPRAPQAPKVITDDQIGQAITRGVAYLNSQFTGVQLKGADKIEADTFAGLDALAIYALLHCGQALNDPKLTLQSDQMKSLLDRLKEFPMNGTRATYSRSLRISALGVYNRPEDRQMLESDLQWLLKASMRGAYTYDMPMPNRTRDDNVWDNSNSQYGALGVWAASEAGLRVPGNYWNDVEQHWISTQVLSGGWGYNPTAKTATLSMTVAGTAMLFVARDRPLTSSQSSSTYTPLSRAMVRAMDWLDEGNNAVKIDTHRGYTAYGLERVGLASGFKYFGTHDWYRELGASLIADQQKDGSWTGTDGPIAETSFALLFLSRGRHPTFLAKLKFDGDWNNRPRDVSGFTRFAAYELERPLNWQVADIQRNWWEYSDAPVLLITSNRAPMFKESEINKLRSYSQAGGLILLNTERDSDEFNHFAAELAGMLFPDYPFAPLPNTHPIYSTMYPLQAKPPLSAVSNGSRLLLVHSPTDLTGAWLARPGANQRPAAELSMNIMVYASGRQDFRNRLDSLFVPEPTEPPTAAVPVARLKYEGNWDPEPMAWARTSRLLQNETGVALRTVPLPINELKYESAPIAHLTGTGELSVRDSDLTAIREFVTKGGILLIDACGASQTFADSVEKNLFSKLFPTAPIEAIAPSDPLLSGTRDGIKDIRATSMREGTPQGSAILRAVRSGAGQVIFSRIDITSGLSGSRAIGIRGYQPAWCQDLVRNISFATIARITDLVTPTSRPSN